MKLLILIILLFLCFKGQCNDYCEHGSLKLVDGGTYNGRLEICINFVWGTVCDDSFDTIDAKVACRQLGYEVDGGQTLTYYTNAYYGQGSGPIWLNRLYCTGTEGSLLECERRYDIGYPYHCSHYEDVSIVCPVNCTQGDVRLTDGLVPNEGTVEVCYNGAWDSVCDSYWGYQEAFVVCKQLGFPSTGAESLSSNYFGTGHGIPTLTNWRCFGNETKLLDCLHTSGSSCFSSSGMYRRASIRCTGMIVLDSCGTSGNMQLVGPNGPNKVEGRVEYCSNGLWGTVSYYGFDVNDGKVVCRKLGYQEPRVLIFRNYGQGSGPVLFTDLNCNGNEFTLDDCSFDLYPYWYDYYYSHYYDVAVRCMEKVPTGCTHGNIRLVNGSTSHEGRVEICLNGEWGTICDYSWDRRDAQVVCRQLGYVPTWASFYTSSQFGDGDLQQLIWDVQCSYGGSETSLLNCSPKNSSSCNNHYGCSYCYYGHTAGVRCYNSTYCTEGDIRLVGGNSPNEGDIQICRSGVWGFICDYRWQYTGNRNVACRQLGYSNNNWHAYSRYSFFGGSQDTAPLVWDRVNCGGSETSLTQCSKYYYGYRRTCTQTAGIYCADVVNCINSSVRLVDGESDNEGKVEICIDGIWMTTEANYWSYSHAKIVCRQLGYYDKWSVAITDIIWKAKSKRVGYRYLGCTGYETSLNNCSHYYNPWYHTDLTYWYDKIRAGVECQLKSQSESCTNVGAIRLSNGSQSNEGRVEICLDGYWGSVCSTGWDEQDALVTCRQAGYQTLRAIPMYGAFFGRGDGPVHMTSVSCHGNETNLTRCFYMSGIGVDNCYHGKDVGVICLDSPVFYNVTISLSSDQSSLTIGSNVTLHCNVSPSPPINTIYQWNTTVSGVTLSQPISTYPNVTLTVPTGHTQQGNYYCIVKYNGVILGRGHTQIPIKDLLNPVGNKVKSTIIGSNVNFTVDITDSFITDYLRELNWYHNDQQIVNTFNKYSITNDNKTLIITNITKEDVGEYSVKFDGLRLYRYNRDCEQKVLQLLRHYPVLSPTVFYVSVEGNGDDITKSSAARCSVSTYPVTGFNKTTQKAVVISFLNEDKQYSNEAQVIWYHDGSRVTSGMTSSHLGLYSKPYYSLSINNPTVLHSGYYESQLTVTPSTVLPSLSCSNSYQDFLTSSSYLNLSTIVIDSIVQRLEYYETPSVNLTTDKTSFNSTSNAELVCSVSGGYPLYYNITLMKNGLSIANIIGSSQLVYNTEEDQTGSKYGDYKCVVDNTVIVVKTAIVTLTEDTVNITNTTNTTSKTDASTANNSDSLLAGLFIAGFFCSAIVFMIVIVIGLVCFAILRRNTTEKNNESESVRYSLSQGVRVPDTSLQIKKEVFNNNPQPFNVQKPAMKSKSVDTSKVHLGNPNYIKAGTKPPIRPKPAFKAKDEEYVDVLDIAEEMEAYESINIYD